MGCGLVFVEKRVLSRCESGREISLFLSVSPPFSRDEMFSWWGEVLPVRPPGFRHPGGKMVGTPRGLGGMKTG